MSVTALADPSTADQSAAAATPAAEQPHGILHVPDYTGDLWTRSRLTGDWGGTRTEWANKGIQFETIFTQTMQSVVDGGRDTATRYGGSIDYVLNLDLIRMGILPGALVKFRGETRYGEAINDRTGSILPANTDGLFPLGDSSDEDIPFTLTSLTYTPQCRPVSSGGRLRRLLRSCSGPSLANRINSSGRWKVNTSRLQG